METLKTEVLNNFDEINIASVEKAIKSTRQQKGAVFTMLQENTECNVEVTEGSMEKCANMLFS